MPDSLAERTLIQLFDGALAVGPQRSGPGAGEVWMSDDGQCVGGGFPGRACPAIPAVAILVEDVERLVAQLREFRAPARAAAHGIVVLNRADDVDLLAVVHLIPQRLQDLPERRPFRVPAAHQLRDVLEADVAGEQLFVVENPY